MSAEGRRPVLGSAPGASAGAQTLTFGNDLRARSQHDDPWGPVLTLGNRAVKIGAFIGLFLALSTHGFMSVRALMALYDMQKGVEEIRTSIHEFLWTEYDIDVKPDVKPPEPEKKVEEPPPEPEPEPIVQQVKVDRPKDDPYEPEKAAPVQAAKVLTAAPDPNKIEDLTGDGIVSGSATDGPLGGQSSAAGTSTIITKNPSVSLTGKPGGTGTGTAPPPPTVAKVDLSKTATVVGSLSWNCPFPAEADDEQIDFAQVTLVVTVRADGSPQSVQVMNDPGHGFGRAARLCALARKYTAGLDADGNATTKSTPPIRVSFTR